MEEKNDTVNCNPAQSHCLCSDGMCRYRCGIEI